MEGSSARTSSGQGSLHVYRYITHPHDCFSIAPTRDLAEMASAHVHCFASLYRRS